MIQVNLQNRKRLTDSEKEPVVSGWGRPAGCTGEVCGDGTVMEFGMDIYTRLYLKWITNKVLLYSPWNSAQLSLEGKGVWGRRDTRVCMTEFPCSSPETVTTLLIGYAPIQDMTFIWKRKKKKQQTSESGFQKRYKFLWQWNIRSPFTLIFKPLENYHRYYPYS